MDITIHTRNVDLNEPLRRAVAAKVDRLGRFLEGMDRAEVRFTEERNPRIADRAVCEVTMHGHGHVVRARAQASEPPVAVDRVVDKLEQQLTKLKGRLVGRSHARHVGHHNNGHVDLQPAGPPRQVRPSPEDARLGEPAETEGGERIVRTKKFSIKPMTPEDAALHMDLLGHTFYFFTNSETDRAAVVYRRNDGQVGLIDAT